MIYRRNVVSTWLVTVSLPFLMTMSRSGIAATAAAGSAQSSTTTSARAFPQAVVAQTKRARPVLGRHAQAPSADHSLRLGVSAPR
jgi:hypothetical protein